jgi:hypothetical protein
VAETVTVEAAETAALAAATVVAAETEAVEVAAATRSAATLRLVRSQRGHAHMHKAQSPRAVRGRLLKRAVRSVQTERRASSSERSGVCRQSGDGGGGEEEERRGEGEERRRRGEERRGHVPSTWRHLLPVHRIDPCCQVLLNLCMLTWPAWRLADTHRLLRPWAMDGQVDVVELARLERETCASQHLFGRLVRLAVPRPLAAHADHVSTGERHHRLQPLVDLWPSCAAI